MSTLTIKIIASGFAIIAIFGFAAYMSGGVDEFFKNFLSADSSSKSETIALDAPNERIQNATVSVIASAKLPTKTRRNTKIVSSVVSSTPQLSGAPHIVISELMTGMKGNSNYDFIELYNDSDMSALLTNTSIKKKSGSGKESSLVAESRLAGKIIPAHGYFLLANERGYTGAIKPDVIWPSSYSFAAAKNGATLYINERAVDAVYWDAIPDGFSLVRDGWGSTSFHISTTPTPQTSR